MLSREERFVLQNNRRSHVIILGSESNRKHQVAASVILMDVKFEYCLKIFAQDFTLNFVKNWHFAPLIFPLLVNKFEYS